MADPETSETVLETMNWPADASGPRTGFPPSFHSVS